MKRILYFIVAMVLAIGCLSACGSNDDTGKPAQGSSADGSAFAEASGKPLQIVTTIFPEYAWVREILGENPAGAEVTMLLDKGVDLHSYQPTVDDILKISNADLFLYVGGESDEWVEDALKEVANPNQISLNLLEMLGDQVKEEEEKEGMQEHEHEHEEDGDNEDADHEEHDHEEGESDEHVWLSLRNAAALTAQIKENIQSLDPANADLYEANAAAFTDKLNELDAEYTAVVEAAPVKTLLFGDRFPFRYLVDDYGLDYFAAFAGCSAETEASFETITFLAEKVDELGLHTVLTIEGTDHKIAETIVNNTKTKDQQILSLDSMQSVTGEDVEAGANYLDIMQKNLDIIKEALK